MDKKIKLLIIQSYAYQIGGVVTFLHYLVKYLDKSKFEPIVLFLSKGKAIAEFKSMGVPARVINSGRLSNIILAIITVLRIMWLIYKEKIDIVFSNDCRESIYGGIAAYFAGIPATFFWHSFFSRHPLARISLAIPTTAIFTNNKEKKEAIEKYYNKKNIYYIQIGIEMKEGVEPNMRQKLGLSVDAPLITQVSHLIPWKGHTYFIKSVPRIINYCPEAKFIIVGSKPSPKFLFYENELKELVKSLRLGNSIIFLDYIENRREFLGILVASDIIVHPAVYEDYGITILEAWLYSKPVIAVNGGGPKQFIADGIDGILVPPNNSDAIAEAVIWLLKNPNICEVIGQKAKKKVEKYFNVKKMAREIEQVFESKKR